jgi:HK97 family phage portal protein
LNILQRLGTAFSIVFKRYTLPDYLKTQFAFPNMGANDSGQNVNVYTGSKITTVFSSINVIAQDIATADIQVFRKGENGKELLENDQIEKLLDRQPNKYMSAYAFRYCMTFIGESRGESNAWIERDGNFNPIALWPLDPDTVTRHTDDAGHRWYEINKVRFETRDIFTYFTFSLDGWRGESKIVWNAQLIGLKMKTHKYKSYAVGNQTPGFLKGSVNSTQAAEIAQAWKNATDKGTTPFLFGEDIDYKQLMFSPEQTDIVMSEKWTDTMTFSIFRMQPVMVSVHEDSNYSNAEQQSIIHTQYTLNAPAKVWEQEANIKLVSETEKQRPNTKYVKLSFDHVMDTATMMNKIQVLTTNGVWKADDVLDKLNQPHQPDGLGQTYWIQGAMKDKSLPEAETTQGQRMLQEVEDILSKYKLNGHEKG